MISAVRWSRHRGVRSERWAASTILAQSAALPIDVGGQRPRRRRCPLRPPGAWFPRRLRPRWVDLRDVALARLAGEQHSPWRARCRWSRPASWPAPTTTAISPSSMAAVAVSSRWVVDRVDPVCVELRPGGVQHHRSLGAPPQGEDHVHPLLVADAAPSSAQVAFGDELVGVQFADRSPWSAPRRPPRSACSPPRRP